MELPPYVTPSREGAYVDVFVQPRAAKEAVVGVQGPALKLKITEPPADGRANDATERLVELLGLPRTSVTLAKGATSRHKRLAVSGMAAEDVACELMRVLSSRAHEPG